MDQLGRLKQTLAKLGPTRLLALAAVGAAVLALVAFVALRSSESMGLLYAGMDLTEAGRVAAKLDEMKIPVQARDGGTTLFVPQSEVARARMALAVAGLPHQGGPGYELLDSQSPMSMTSFTCSCGTAPATSRRIAAACEAVSRSAPIMVTATEAVGVTSVRAKLSCSGSTIWTRAERTPSSVRMLRASSPSSARSPSMRCMNEVMLIGDWLSSSS